MAFKSYLPRFFDYTHENSFFRAFSGDLSRTFNNKDGLHILIGNLSCQGHQIDAVFISSGKIIVIDFKNYGGTLTFSENNPWQISKGNDFVFVKGGGGIRNPYQQVNAYRHSLIQYFGNKQVEILDTNHANFNLGHISSLVVFHQPITFDNTSIPQNIQKYFSVSDNNNCVKEIIDRVSTQLTLSDIEIVNILKVLDIRAENIFDENTNNDIVPIKSSTSGAKRLDQVRRELEKIDYSNTADIDKLLLYYQTIISLERTKEPKVNDEHFIPVIWNEITDRLSINLQINPDFHQLFQQNIQHQFPKNLFVGLNFSFKSQRLSLFYTIIQYRDILNYQNIELSLNEFALFSKPLEDRNYPAELIEELNTELNQKSTFSDRIEVLKKQLDEGIELSDNITLALSEENPFTSQLQSELRRIYKDKLVQNNSLLESFLYQTPLTGKVQQIPSSEILKLSNLNSEQRSAIELAFNQPLTVITGPPGTGKTQVVLNIVANAIFHNKKVLVASKNNQAVDNVKERFLALVKESGYFLRFGSKSELTGKTKPLIQSYVSKIFNRLIPDNSERYAALIKSFEDKRTIINSALKQLGSKDELEIEIPNLRNKKEAAEIELENWLASIDGELMDAFCNNLSYINTLHSKIIYQKNEVLYRYSGLKKIYFDLFLKKREQVKLLSVYESFIPELKSVAQKNHFEIILSELRNGKEIISSYNRLLNFIEAGIKIQNEKTRHERLINSLNLKISEKISALTELLNNIGLYNQEIEDSQLAIDNISPQIIEESIIRKLYNADPSVLNKYVSYISENIPWKREQVHEFITTADKFLKIFNINAITSLSIKNSFPLTNDLFDILVIDEASQCDIASAIPLILRAKQLVVIGDPMQLKHITKVQDYEEKYIINTIGLDANLRLNYANNSLYDYCYDLSIDSKMRGAFLKNHYRCHPEIIEYSNKAFYGPKMGQELNVCTNKERFSVEPKGIYWLNISGDQHVERNSNKKELEASIDLACNIAEKYPQISIGITTPFRHQADDLRAYIPQKYKERIKADVVHSFQGDEKDVMIFSLVVSSNSPKHKAEWMNNTVPYLINVAVTRARNTLYIIGNANYCKTLPPNSPIGILVKYVDGINSIRNHF